jgi:DNA-binding NarL/FixJ family response regulator
MSRELHRHRIVLADDHAIFRDGLKLLLGMQPGFDVVGEVGDLSHLMDCVRTTQPSAVVMDYHMPGGDTSALMAYLGQRHPDIKRVALTAARSGVVLKQLLAVKADAVLLKDCSGAELVACLREVLVHGRTVIAPEVLRLAEAADGGLTRRELQILKLLYDGQSNQAIAQTLSLSPKTVDKHRENIMRKMEVNSLAQLFKTVHARGLLLATSDDEASSTPT